MGALLAKTDIFPYSPIVRLNQSEKVKSKFSGFVSILLLILILYLVYFKLLEMFESTIAYYQTSEVVNFDQNKKLSNLYFAVGFLSFDDRSLDSILTFSIRVYYKGYYNFTDYEMVDCDWNDMMNYMNGSDSTDGIDP